MQINVGNTLPLHGKRWVVQAIHESKTQMITKIGGKAYKADNKQTPYFTFMAQDYGEWEEGDVVTREEQFLELIIPGTDEWHRLYIYDRVKKETGCLTSKI